MSRDIDDLIAAELRQLRLLIEPQRPLIARSLRGPVELETLDALSALLHSFYTAIERILVPTLYLLLESLPNHVLPTAAPNQHLPPMQIRFAKAKLKTPQLRSPDP